MITEKHHASVVAEQFSLAAAGFLVCKQNLRLRSMSQKIKSGIVVKKEIVWPPSLRADDIWSLHWIATEKDWLFESVKTPNPHWWGAYPVQADNIIISFSSIELDSEAERVSGQIGKLSTQGNGGVPNEDRSFDTRASKEMRLHYDISAVVFVMVVCLTFVN